MKLVSYLREETDQLAILANGLLYNTQDLHPDLPNNMGMFLMMWEDVIEIAKQADAMLKEGKHPGGATGIPVDSVDLLSPVPFPTSCRDGYAFRQHVEAARRNRKVPMIPEFDQYPIFYFTNHNAIQGPGAVSCMPDHFQKLDFELEVAIVICKAGRNITAAEADEYIGGYMIMNDMSARTLQMEEMLLNLGPAKGKDFSTVVGPMLVTPDELEAYKIPAKPGHTGNNYNLKMTCKVNGIQVSEGNMGDMDWTFAEIVERCAYGANILPGDIIGSGTVGTGCFLELNGTGKLNDPEYKEQWLQPEDVVEMEVTGLGTLTNIIKQEDSDFSILALKKK
ncbi:fumarylacetoacetate (FAA) hydrolase [Chitinophaga terrae (ex Kim and Jung 2007)]|uniref:fumarylacetoacetate hydrolase family protein n=1 Tax=Chitinophaga terrae (ex Kim and Jung 2007) TaxID=408074 RepID=UPI00277DA6EE|nr:fumarylacetoacetate hydrolase family protein [Chitinophaga terrae (ex Kim and Jung 2007)]MDQ0105031.1 fumarylacetoacetate (FAA) hydrolase [Chitinophaga terrae (ex Kim and Jung 2007)]